jgi:hypothetical protein
MKAAAASLPDPKKISDFLALCAACGSTPRDLKAIARQISAFQRNSRSLLSDRDDGPAGAAMSPRRQFNPQSKGHRPMSAYNPMQEAADEASGFEGLVLKHNCKEGVVYLDDRPVGPEFNACLFISEACHDSLEFDSDQNPKDKEILRYADVKPSHGKMELGRKPNTSVLGIDMSTHQLLTYTSASWSVRQAFEAQLLKPFMRMKGRGFPVVSLGFKEGKDSNGNHRPTFAVERWEPRSRFAEILGEAAPRPLLEGPEGPAWRLESPMRPAAPITEDALDGAGHPLDEDIPF